MVICEGRPKGRSNLASLSLLTAVAVVVVVVVASVLTADVDCGVTLRTLSELNENPLKPPPLLLSAAEAAGSLVLKPPKPLNVEVVGGVAVFVSKPASGFLISPAGGAVVVVVLLMKLPPPLLLLSVVSVDFNSFAPRWCSSGDVGLDDCEECINCEARLRSLLSDILYEFV